MPIAYEYQWPAVAQALSANGTAQGLITVPNTDGYFVLQDVLLAGTALPSLPCQVVEVISPTQLYVGPRQQSSKVRYRANFVDASAYTTAATSTITAAQQNKRLPTPNQAVQSLLEAEPVLALRAKLVDDRGQSQFKAQTFNSLRASTILTNAYVASTALDISSANMVDCLVLFTKGSLTNAMIKFELSDDGATWYPITTPNGAVTVAGDEAQQSQLIDVKVLAPATVLGYRFAFFPVKAKFFRAQALGTGTVTSSLLKIDAYAGIV